MKRYRVTVKILLKSINCVSVKEIEFNAKNNVEAEKIAIDVAKKMTNYSSHELLTVDVDRRFPWGWRPV